MRRDPCTWERRRNAFYRSLCRHAEQRRRSAQQGKKWCGDAGTHGGVREASRETHAPREMSAPVRSIALLDLPSRQPLPAHRSERHPPRRASSWQRSHADCSAMLMPSPMMGCTSPAALPMRNALPRAPVRRTPGRRGPAGEPGAHSRGARQGFPHPAALATQERLDHLAGSWPCCGVLMAAGRQSVAPDAAGEGGRALTRDDHAAIASGKRQHGQQAAVQARRCGRSP